MKDITCPNCQSDQINKNGKRQGKQLYQCRNCKRQFLHEQDYCASRQYPPGVKELCLKMHLQKNLKLREIERLTDIHHTTIKLWVQATSSTDSPSFKLQQ